MFPNSPDRSLAHSLAHLALAHLTPLGNGSRAGSGFHELPGTSGTSPRPLGAVAAFRAQWALSCTSHRLQTSLPARRPALSRLFPTLGPDEQHDHTGQGLSRPGLTPCVSPLLPSSAPVPRPHTAPRAAPQPARRPRRPLRRLPPPGMRTPAACPAQSCSPRCLSCLCREVILTVPRPDLSPPAHLACALSGPALSTA